MNSTVIDTLSISKRLEKAGYTDKQANAQAEIWAEIIDKYLATKRDLREEIQNLEYRLTFRLGSMMVIGISIVAALVKLL